MSNIHKTAIIGEKVKLGNNVKIGAYSVIDGDVEIGDECEILSHVNITGKTKIGKNNKFYPFSVVGIEPQDLKFHGEDTKLIIGDNNKIREHVTIHKGTQTGIGKTIIGNNCLFMVASHIAHDCILGNNVILANNATIAGHVEIGDFAIIGGLSAIHQFVRIGNHAMIGGMSGIEGDIIPYGTAYGERASLQGLNLVGLKRREFSRDQITKLRRAYKRLFTDISSLNNLKERIENLMREYKDDKEVTDILSFLSKAENRSICLPKK
jgi:UDP-N-acetylglucosamine acyltransferase